MVDEQSEKNISQERKNETLLCDLAYIYLYIPIILFLITWIKLEVALVCVGLLVVVFVKNGGGKWEKTKVRNIHFGEGILIVVIFSIWCVLSGQGAVVGQPFDWAKHNAIFQDLIRYPWPIQYNMGNENGVLSYYIAEYLVPAGVGKVFGLHVAEMVMLLQVLLGLVLTVLCLGCFLGEIKKGKILKLAIIMIFFGTFMYVFRMLYRGMYPEDIGGQHWFSRTISLQYSTHVVMLRWVFPQCVPTWLATTLLLIKQDEKKSWAMIAAPLILYSTFAFVGFVFVAGISLVFEIALKQKKKEVLKDVFSVENILVLVAFIPIVIYILCNVFQPKTASVSMEFKMIDYSEHIMVLILFECAWLLWVILIYKKEKNNHFLYASVIVLSFLPLFQYGIYNDLCMRGSISALFLLFVFVAKNILDEENSMKYRKILFALVIVNALHWDGGILEPIVEVSLNGIHKDNRCVSKYEEEYGTSLFTGGEPDVMKYQYVNWHYREDWSRYILKTEISH